MRIKESIHISLPDQYDLVVGDTFQLFYRGVIEAPNPYFYDILVTCEKGCNYPRYFEYTPEETGQHKLTISVYANDKSLLGEASTICQTESSPKQKTNILCVGDSLTANGIWVGEVYRRIASDSGEPKGHGLSNLVDVENYLNILLEEIKEGKELQYPLLDLKDTRQIESEMSKLLR